MNYRILSGSALKIIAVIAMICDHCAKLLLVPKGIIGKSAYIAMSWGIGRIAFPLFALLLVEGFLHTKNVKKYALNLALFAFLTIFPWNLASTGHLLVFSKTNVLFTLLLGLISIWCLDKFEGWKSFFGLVFCLVISYLIKSDYSITGILTIVLIYALREKREYQALSSFACLFRGKTTSGLLLAMPLICMYNGERGFIKGKLWKYLFYSIYPIHLLLIYFLRTI